MANPIVSPRKFRLYGLNPRRTEGNSLGRKPSELRASATHSPPGGGTIDDWRVFLQFFFAIGPSRPRLRIQVRHQVHLLRRPRGLIGNGNRSRPDLGFSLRHSRALSAKSSRTRGGPSTSDAKETPIASRTIGSLAFCCNQVSQPNYLADRRFHARSGRPSLTSRAGWTLLL